MMVNKIACRRIFCSREAIAQSWWWRDKSSEWPRYGNICHVIMAKPWQIPSLKEATEKGSQNLSA